MTPRKTTRSERIGPSLIDQWAKGCVRKKRYEYREDAERAGKKWNNRVYPCKFCLGYHLAKRK